MQAAAAALGACTPLTALAPLQAHVCSQAAIPPSQRKPSSCCPEAVWLCRACLEDCQAGLAQVKAAAGELDVHDQEVLLDKLSAMASRAHSALQQVRSQSHGKAALHERRTAHTAAGSVPQLVYNCAALAPCVPPESWRGWQRGAPGQLSAMASRAHSALQQVCCWSVAGVTAAAWHSCTGSAALAALVLAIALRA